MHTSWLSHFQGSSVCQVTAIGVTVILLYTSRACYNLFILSFPQSRNVHPFDYDWYNVSDQVSGRGGAERAGRSPLPFGRRGRRRRFLWCPPPRVRGGTVAPAVPARMSREKLGHVCVRTHACTHACTCTHTHTLLSAFYLRGGFCQAEPKFFQVLPYKCKTVLFKGEICTGKTNYI